MRRVARILPRHSAETRMRVGAHAGHAAEGCSDAVGEPADGLAGVTVAGHRASFAGAASSSSSQVLAAARLVHHALVHHLALALSTRRPARPHLHRSVCLPPE